MRWPRIEEIYGVALKQTSVFDLTTEGGQKRYKALHKRVIEHVNLEYLKKFNFFRTFVL